MSYPAPWIWNHYDPITCTPPLKQLHLLVALFWRRTFQAQERGKKYEFMKHHWKLLRRYEYIEQWWKWIILQKSHSGSWVGKRLETVINTYQKLITPPKTLFFSMPEYRWYMMGREMEGGRKGVRKKGKWREEGGRGIERCKKEAE